jgi:hypothetical protein
MSLIIIGMYVLLKYDTLKLYTITVKDGWEGCGNAGMRE